MIFIYNFLHFLNNENYIDLSCNQILNNDFEESFKMFLVIDGVFVVKTIMFLYRLIHLVMVAGNVEIIIGFVYCC